MVIEARLAQIAGMPISAGSHSDLQHGACILEMVSFVAGEPFSDHPKCVCPVIGAFMRALNDGLPENERNTLLRPFIPRLVGTRSTTAVERRRTDLALDWMVRVYAPAWLDLSEALSVHATAIRALSPVTSRTALVAAQPLLMAAAMAAAAARAAAGAAAVDAARAAAGAAAWAAAGAAAVDAARAAAGAAAWAAARAAATDVAWDAAMDAARAAAMDAVESTVGSGAPYGAAYAAALPACVALLAPTRDTLQGSALELLDRMLATTPRRRRARRT